MCYTNWERKDFKWAMAVLTVIMIGILTLYSGGKGNEIVSYASFAGTITSVILSVVAIVYSFTQSASSASHAQRLADASLSIKDSVSTLSDSRDKISDAVQALEETNETLRVSVEPLATLCNQVQRVETAVGEVGENLSVVLRTMHPSNVDRKAQLRENPAGIVGLLSAWGLGLLFLYVKQCQHPLRMDLARLADEVNRRVGKSPGFVQDWMVIGYLLAFWYLTGLVDDVSFTEFGGKMDERLPELVEREVEVRLSKGDAGPLTGLAAAIRDLYEVSQAS